ncbi:MAG: T9SS type A sorting domain-containing protein [Candidatus Kapabacteria bacterium]|nr:T9SS type A sorting domain-containing protein [Candidatus Kapabacteria bacterium]
MRLFVQASLVVLVGCLAATTSLAKSDAFIVYMPSKQLANGYTTMPRAIKVTRPAEGTYVPGIVIVKTRASYRVGKGEQTLASATLAPVLDYMQTRSVEHAMVPATKTNEPDIVAAGIDRIYRIAYNEPIEPFDLCKRLMENPDVEYAMPERIFQPMYTPNDPRLASQGYLTPMKAAAAWDVTKGSKDVIVAIVDSGLDWTHEDLAANIFSNKKEIAGNGKDDDGNGYVDDVRGWDFVGNVTLQEVAGGTLKPDNDPKVTGSIDDRKGHGTTVGGCAAGIGDNGKGIAGLGFGVTILPCKIGSDNSSFAGLLQGYQAIQYAADMGAHIINCSWGGPGMDPGAQEIIDYAISKGSLVVAASGNSGVDTDQFEFTPACLDGVLSVGSTDNNDRVSSFSNYGWRMTTFAPGQSMLSTFPNNQYRAADGTSFSSPVVSGICALVKSIHADWTPQQIMAQIRGTSDAMASVPPQNRPKYWGRVNAERAVKINRLWTSGERIPGLIVSNFRVGSGTAITKREPTDVVVTVKNVLADASTSTVEIASLDSRVTIVSGSSTNSGALPRDGSRDITVRLQPSANYPWYEASVPLAVTMRSGTYSNLQVVSIPLRLTSNNALVLSGNADGLLFTNAKNVGNSEIWGTAIASNGQNAWYRIASGRISANALSFKPVAFDAVAGKGIIGGMNSSTPTIARYSGGSWPATNVAAIASSVIGIHMRSANEGVFIGDAVTNRFGVGRSTDGGVTWTAYGTAPQILTGEKLRPNVYFFDGDNMWFVTTNNRMGRSTDGGKTWQMSTMGLTGATPIAVAFRDATNGLLLYSISGGYKLASSIDGGTKWTALPTDLKPLGADPLTISSSGDHHLIVCKDGAVFGTDDNGATYQPVLSMEQMQPLNSARAQKFTSSTVVFAGQMVTTLTYRYNGPNGTKILESTQTAVNFDTLTPQQGRNRFVTVRSTGTGTATIDSIRIIPSSGVSDTAFKVTNTPSTTIESGSSSQITIRFSATDPGMYTATLRVVSNATPSVITVPLTAVVSTPVSVLDEGAMEAVGVMPNPTSDRLLVRLPGDRAATLTLIDVQGRTMIMRNTAAGMQEASLDVAGLASGTYYVVVTGEGLAKMMAVTITR